MPHIFKRKRSKEHQYVTGDPGMAAYLLYHGFHFDGIFDSEEVREFVFSGTDIMPAVL